MCLLGVDAQIVLNFHTMREQSPDKFVGRFINQFWYGIMGWNEIWQPHCTNLKKFMTLLVDGKEVDLPDDTEGLIFSNIPSFGGGMKLWDVNNETSTSAPEPDRSYDNNSDDEIRDAPLSSSTRRRSARLKSIRSQEQASKDQSQSSESSNKWKPASIQDGKLEIVAVTGSLHLAQLKLGLTSCVKVAQTSSIEIRLLRPLPLQVDGEPWVQDKCVIRIYCSEKMVMLKRRCEFRSSDEVSDVLNWAERTQVISSKQKLALLSEFSRRAEVDEL
jgi:diacylglycerol kinase (ATP)